MAVGIAVPGADFLVEGLQVWNTPCAQTLSRKHTDFDLGLVKPASMLGRIVNGESVLDFATSLLAKQVGQRLAAVNVQIVQHQMNGFGFGICHRQFEDDMGELTP